MNGHEFGNEFMSESMSEADTDMTFFGTSDTDMDKVITSDADADTDKHRTRVSAHLCPRFHTTLI